MWILQGGNLGILPRMSEDCCLFFNNVLVTKQRNTFSQECDTHGNWYGTGCTWVFIQAIAESRTSSDIWFHVDTSRSIKIYIYMLYRLYMFFHLYKKMQVFVSFWCKCWCPTLRSNCQIADSLKSLKWRPQRWKPCSLVASCQAGRLVREWDG